MEFRNKFNGNLQDPSKGIRVLHQMILNNIVEIQDLMGLIKLRIIAEENFSNSLEAIQKLKRKSNESVRTITGLLNQYQIEMGGLASARRNMVMSMRILLEPLENFIAECKEKTSTAAETIYTGWERYNVLFKEVQHLDSIAALKCRTYSEMGEIPLEDEDPDDKNDMVIIGSSNIMTIDELNELIADIRVEVPFKDIWSLFGNSRDCYLGSDLLDWLLKNKWSETDSLDFFNYLIENKKLVAAQNRKTPNFNKETFYQWHSTAIEQPVGSKGKLSEANRAVVKLNRASNRLDTVKQTLELQMENFFGFTEELLKHHITFLTTTMIALLDIDTSSIESIKALRDRLNIYVETIDPEKEVHAIAEEHKTGVKPIPTFVPRKFLLNLPELVVFGVPLENAREGKGSRVPRIVRFCIAALQEKQTAGDFDALDCWIQKDRNLSIVQGIRKEINQNGVESKSLDKYSPDIIVQLIKQYLIELPHSLCHPEIYEPLKMVYFSKTEEGVTGRLGSIRNILATMPSAHFHTISFLASYWGSLIAGLPENSPKISQLAQELAPYILRPEKETQITVNDSHCHRFSRDIITHCSDLIHAEFLTPANSLEMINEVDKISKSSSAILHSSVLEQY